MIQYKSAYLALKSWNELQQDCHIRKNKEIVYEEDWEDTCKRLGMEYIKF